jgi:hypothetical protein
VRKRTFCRACGFLVCFWKLSAWASRGITSQQKTPQKDKRGGNDWSARPVQAALAAVLYAQGLLDDLDVVVVELEAK